MKKLITISFDFGLGRVGLETALNTINSTEGVINHLFSDEEAKDLFISGEHNVLVELCNKLLTLANSPLHCETVTEGFHLSL